MFRKTIHLVVTLTVMLGLLTALPFFAESARAQCSRSTAVSSQKACCSSAAKAACTPAGKSCCPASRNSCRSQKTAAIKKMSTRLPYHESKRVTLVGTYECGKCSLDVLQSCQGFIRTDDGGLYPLLKRGGFMGMCTSAMAKREARFKAVGRVRLIDGVTYLDVIKLSKI